MPAGFSVRWRLWLILVVTLTMLMVSGVQAQQKWEVLEVGGTSYVRLQDMCRFYRFGKVQGRSGCISYGAGNRVLSFRPGKQDFYVNNYRYILSYPVKAHEGDLLISTVDVKKLVDPVLRPRFSPHTSKITTVIIDAGHGGHDRGAVSSYAVEKECNLAVALKLREKLLRRGFKVVMTRKGDYFLTLGQRVAIANKYPDSIFVSIHHNSGGSSGKGIETFTLAPHGTTSPFARTRRTEDLAGNNQDSENIALATAVHSRVIKATQAVDRGIQRARFSVLCTIKRPAILFEGGFVSNPEEGRRISSESYREMLATSICEGIVGYCHVANNRRGVKKTMRRSAMSTGALRLKSRRSGS